MLGGILLAVLAHMWDANEKERDRTVTYERALTTERLSLIKEFGETFQKTVSTLNSWFTTVVWIADEHNKPQTSAVDAHIKTWTEQAQKLEERYAAVMPLDATLTRIGVLFKCQSVRDISSQMLKRWKVFEAAFAAFNRDWDDKQLLSDEAIRKNETLRRDSLGALEAMQATLIERMAGELAGGRETPPHCPP